jgi:hypothetical protein
VSVSIPAFHVSDLSKVKGKGEVFIASRKDAASAGVFSVEVAVQFDPTADDYPTGTLIIVTDLSDSAKNRFRATSIELINSHGKHTPTVFLTGRCVARGDDRSYDLKGLRYWLMIADNKREDDREGTPDVVGFAIHNRKGDRIAYGTGPVRKGDFIVAPK